MSRWQFNHVVASRCRRGRLFIAGDAAHRHAPANGLGSNTSMQDTYKLVWKLALVLRGLADDGLLDNYDAERQPVGRQILDRAHQNVDEMLRWFTALGLRPDTTPDEADARLAELHGPEGEPQRAELGVAIEGAQVSLGLDVNDVYGGWIRRREVGDRGCVLVRPDRIVAWRSPDAVDDPKETLRAAMSAILGVGGRA